MRSSQETPPQWRRRLTRPLRRMRKLCRAPGQEPHPDMRVGKAAVSDRHGRPRSSAADCAYCREALSTALHGVLPSQPRTLIGWQPEWTPYLNSSGRKLALDDRDGRCAVVRSANRNFGASSRAGDSPSTAQNIRCKAKCGRLTSLRILMVAGAADARQSHWRTGWCCCLQPLGGMPCWRPDLAVAQPDFGSPCTHLLSTYTSCCNRGGRFAAVGLAHRLVLALAAARRNPLAPPRLADMLHAAAARWATGALPSASPPPLGRVWTLAQCMTLTTKL